jgi:AraC-like DNA-binding protein
MRDTETGGIFFDTDALPERDRFPAFCEGMFRHVVGADIVQQGPTPFRGVLKVRQAAGLIIANIATTPSDIVRSKVHVSDGDDALVFGLWQRGRGHVEQGRNESRIDMSNGFVLDNGNCAVIHVQEACRFWGLTIPRNRMAGVTPDISRLAGTKIHDRRCLQLLTGYLEGTLAQDFDSDPSTKLFGDHLVDLICLALAGDGDTRELEMRSGISATRLAAILRMISDQSTDPGLSAAVIAAQLGVTPRYVHVLLEKSGQTFMQHVLQKRLEKAEQRLSSDVDQHRKIADIAMEVGFSDLSHFNRSFRRYFGDTPSGLRAIRAKRGT